MRPATKEERESVDNYIKLIANKTGIVYTAGDVDYKEDINIDFFRERPKADMSNVNRVRINKKVYLSADKVLEILDEVAQMADQNMPLELVNRRVKTLKEGGQE